MTEKKKMKTNIGKSIKWRTQLLEDAQNIILIEDQVILVIDLDVVTTKSRNKHSEGKKIAYKTTYHPSSQSRE